MLIGRDRTLRTLDELLANARTGTSGALVLVGEAGIGKTRLLDYTAERAAEMSVLRVRGVESEADIPFAGLLELLRPTLPALGRIPEPQARAMSAALAIGGGGKLDRFAVGAATLALIAAEAEDRPVVVLVDDLQWIDRASAAAIGFAARRLMADRVALIAAARDPDAAFAGLPTLTLEGLDRAAAAELAQQRARVPLTPDALERLYRATAGNPLATTELADDAATLAAQPDGSAVNLSARLAEAFLRQVGAIGPDARRMLLLTAACDRADMATLAPAAGELGVDIALLGEAEEAGIVTLRDGLVTFGHPLVRSAIYSAATAAERREVHAVLAVGLPDADLDRRAWHLAAAAFGPDAVASAALAAAAARAAERGASAVAAAGFARASGLAPDVADRQVLLCDAAEAAWDGGLTQRALELLDAADATPAPPDGATAARIERTRGHALIGCGRLREGHLAMTRAADGLSAIDRPAAVLALAEATDALFFTGDVEAMLAAGERAYLLAGGTDDAASLFFGGLAYGMALVLSGEGRQGSYLIREALRLAETSQAVPADTRLIALAATAPLFLRDAGSGRFVMTKAIAAARDEGRIGVLSFLLFHVARDLATTADWPGGRAAYGEAIRLAREAGLTTELAASLAGVSWLEARLGLEDDARLHAAEAGELCNRFGLVVFAVWAAAALGDLELGRGDPAAAVTHLERQGDLIGGSGIRDPDLSPAPELVAAYLQLRRPDDAQTTGAAFIRVAEAKAQPWSLARAERVRGMLAATELRRAVRRRPPSPRRDARRVRASAHAARVRRAPAPRAAPHRRARRLA